MRPSHFTILTRQIFIDTPLVNFSEVVRMTGFVEERLNVLAHIEVRTRQLTTRQGIYSLGTNYTGNSLPETECTQGILNKSLAYDGFIIAMTVASVSCFRNGLAA